MKKNEIIALLNRELGFKKNLINPFLTFQGNNIVAVAFRVMSDNHNYYYEAVIDEVLIDDVENTSILDLSMFVDCPNHEQTKVSQLENLFVRYQGYVSGEYGLEESELEQDEPEMIESETVSEIEERPDTIENLQQMSDALSFVDVDRFLVSAKRLFDFYVLEYDEKLSCGEPVDEVKEALYAINYATYKYWLYLYSDDKDLDAFIDKLFVLHMDIIDIFVDRSLCFGSNLYNKYADLFERLPVAA